MESQMEREELAQRIFECLICADILFVDQAPTWTPPFLELLEQNKMMLSKAIGIHCSRIHF